MQQVFSSKTNPTLSNALPAVEALHAAWSKHAVKPKYAIFKDALDAVTEKLDEYYKKTAHRMHISLQWVCCSPVPCNIVGLNNSSASSQDENVTLQEVLGYPSSR